jgi:hexosaminidase
MFTRSFRLVADTRNRLSLEPPAGQLRLASEATTNFTAQLLSAVAKLFPSTLFSTGGDEINANCYTQDLETQKDLNATGKTFEQALDTFTQATHKAIIAEGKTPVVWEGTASSQKLLSRIVQLKMNCQKWSLRTTSLWLITR